MGRFLSILFAALTMVFHSHAMAQNNYVANQVIISTTSDQNCWDAIRTLKELKPEWKLDMHHSLSAHGHIYLLEFDSAVTNPPKVIEQLKLLETVEIAQVNHTNITRRSIVPNDLKYPLQWSMRDTNLNTQIFAPQAWQLETDGISALGDTIVMAVIDGGVDIHHVDLNLFKNSHEIPNNGVDDDQNGYIDDYHGWNANFSNGQPVADYHGTHVAGIMGAKTNNSEGIAGIVWGGSILPVISDGFTESNVLEAYGYVLAQRLKYNESNGDSGAFVVCTNSSFGVDDGDPADYPLWCAFYDSLGAAGIVNLGATTNAFSNVDVWGDIPTTCPSNHLIGVTNLSESGVIQGGYGTTHVDLGAPGRNIYSTTPGHNYAYNSGTSMATPHVAGVVGAMFSALCEDDLIAYKQNPDSIALLIRSKLLQNVTPLNSLNGKIATEGTLNMYQAVLAASNNNCLTATITIEDDSCNACDGSIHVTATSKYPPLTIQIMDMDSVVIADSVALNLCADSHLIAITDSTNLTTYFNRSVTHPDTLKVAFAYTHPSTNTSTDGAIYSSLAGGYLPYSYQWDSGETTQDLSQVMAGLYTLSVTDSANCEIVQTANLFSVSVNEIDPLNAKVYPNPIKQVINISNTTEPITTVSIYTISGQLVQQLNVIPAMEQQVQVNLNQGAYVLLINGKEHHKIMVN